MIAVFVFPVLLAAGAAVFLFPMYWFLDEPGILERVERARERRARRRMLRSAGKGGVKS